MINIAGITESKVRDVRSLPAL